MRLFRREALTIHSYFNISTGISGFSICVLLVGLGVHHSIYFTRGAKSGDLLSIRDAFEHISMILSVSKRCLFPSPSSVP